jgi:hypothetical protein
MKRYGIMVGVVLWFAWSLNSCGNRQQTGTDDLASLFPNKVDEVGLQRGAEIRTFVGDSLWQYIDGGAELYHTYGFVKVSTADYRSNDAELVLDLYLFKTPEGAYGLYSALRPDEPSLVPFGVEGYVTGSSLEFVRGNVMARVIGYEASEAVDRALRALAQEVAKTLPGTTEPPAMFALFPDEGAVKNTDKIIGASFMGQSFLNMVHTRDYQLGGDRLTLFLITDTLGATFADWLMNSSDVEKAAGQAVGLSYDDNYCLLIADTFAGNVIAGLKGGKLAGAINYTDRHRDFVAAWLNRLTQ